jgi:ABC-type branched-subunit amino acid transport system substrate-binding protein
VTTAAVDGFNSRHSNVKIEATFCDSKGTPNGTLSCAAEAKSNGDAGVVLGIGFLDYLLTKQTATAGIPTIAAIANDPQTWNNKSVYCVTSTFTGILKGIGNVAKAAGVSKLGLLTISGTPQAQSYVTLTQQGLAAAGIGYAGAQLLAPNAVDWTSAITQAMSSSPDALELTPAPGPSESAVFTSARQIAPSVKFVEPTEEIDAQLAAAPVMNGTAVSSWAVPPQTPGVQGTAFYRADIAKWGGSIAGTQELAEPYEMLWLGIQLAGNVASTVKGQITPQSLTAALNTSRNVDMYGLTPPYSGANRGADGEACVSNGTVVQSTVKGGKLVAETPGQFIDLATGKTLSSQ